MKKMHYAFVAGALTALLTSGCATPGTDTGMTYSPASAYARALPYPGRLTPVPGDGQALRWIDPTVDFRKYNAILIERIRVSLDPDSSSVDPAELKTLTDYFHQALVRALQPQYRVVDRADTGVLRVRITLVDLVSTKPEMSLVVLATPYATIPDMMSGAATGGGLGSAPYLGRTGIAVEFIDGASNTLIGEYADTKFGQKYVIDAQQGIGNAISTGMSDYLKAYSTWAYAQQAFDQWARQFRARLDQLQGRAPPA